MGRPTRGTKRWVAEREAWRARPPWPCAVLAADPGERAGAALIVPSISGGFGPGHLTHCVWAREVRTYTRDVERCVEDAAREAARLELLLVLIVEEWGRGGPLGIDSWIGLGEMRGAWRRTVVLAADKYPNTIRPSRCVARANMTTWRSHMIEETGDVDAAGRRRAFDPDGWKRAATRACSQIYPYLKLEGANAAEAALIGAYGLRSDEVGRKLPASLLRSRGLEAPPARTARDPRRKERLDAETRRVVEFLGLED